MFEALRSLPDQAVNELDSGDIERFTVVRVGDEICVALMKGGCGVDYAEAIKDDRVFLRKLLEAQGVPVPEPPPPARPSGLRA